MSNKTVTFGTGKREIPANKAKKWYPAEDEPLPKKVRKFQRPTTLRPSLQPGAILIVLAGRFRGKRVVFLKDLDKGILLVTGPFKINGVPLRRVNARYVIATSTKVDLAGVDTDKFDGKYFVCKKDPKKTKEEEFFGAEKKIQGKVCPDTRKEDQKAVDAPLIKTIKQTPHLSSYLASSFALSKGDRPHLMKW